MEISKRVIKQLEQLAAQGLKQVEAVILDSGNQREYIVGVPAEAQTPGIALTLQDYDRYSAVLRQLEVSYPNKTNGQGAGESYLHHCAQQISQRLTYLEEPLVLLELDSGDGLAQLRSDPPCQDGDEVIYWEAMVRLEPHPQVNLARYRWTVGSYEREQVTYPVTFGTLGRLVADLTLSLAQG